ncbi:hypothetical protein J6590_005420 [Homalodisca vitripennis]|nr:hypothetical protein J6590_005420 [Homalodisca vitripennis]
MKKNNFVYISSKLLQSGGKVITECSRDLAKLVRRTVGRWTAVGGVCRSRIDFLDSTIDFPLVAGTCCVIVVGTNDSPPVSTLPRRHDQTSRHPINSVNTVVLDFNRIGRSFFTAYDMQLKSKRKRLLAELLRECLQGLDWADNSVTV